MLKIVLFQTIQCSISILFSSIWPIGVTNPGQSEPGSDCNKGVLHIPKRSSITGASPSDYLVSYAGHLLGEVPYPSAEVQSVYSATPTDWAVRIYLETLA